MASAERRGRGERAGRLAAAEQNFIEADRAARGARRRSRAGRNFATVLADADADAGDVCAIMTELLGAVLADAPTLQALQALGRGSGSRGSGSVLAMRALALFAQLAAVGDALAGLQARCEEIISRGDELADGCTDLLSLVGSVRAQIADS